MSIHETNLSHNSFRKMYSTYSPFIHTYIYSVSVAQVCILAVARLSHCFSAQHTAARTLLHRCEPTIHTRPYSEGVRMRQQTLSGWQKTGTAAATPQSGIPLLELPNTSMVPSPVAM